MATLVVMGDVEQAGDDLHGAELWRTDFVGWDVMHRFLAERRCVPRRYVVIDDGRILASGYSQAPYLRPGEMYRLTLSQPPPRTRSPGDTGGGVAP